MALTKQEILNILTTGFNNIDATNGEIDNSAALDTVAESIFQASEGAVENYVEEAPADGEYYSRRYTTWQVQPTFQDAPIDGKPYQRMDGSWVENTVTDAPSDNKYYERRNGTWVEDVKPLEDGKQYVKKDGSWEQNSSIGTFFDKTDLEDTSLDFNQVQEALVYIFNDHIRGGFHLSDDGYDPNNP